MIAALLLACSPVEAPKGSESAPAPAMGAEPLIALADRIAAEAARLRDDSRAICSAVGASACR